jgi:hypothetical protein
MTEQGNGELGKRFADLRDSDSTHVPSFDAVVARQHGFRDRKVLPRGSRSRLVLGAVAMAAIALLIFASVRRDRGTSDVAVGDWRARSDLLLAIARPTLLDQMPPLHASVLDAVLPEQQQFQIQPSSVRSGQ